jgi:hypothetical protein
MSQIADFAGECANADIYQELLRQHVPLGPEGRSLMENTPFNEWGESRGTFYPGTPMRPPTNIQYSLLSQHINT